MQENIIRILLVIVAMTQFLPIIGVLGAARLSSGYGIIVDDPNLEILLRHRAVLFGLLGLFIFHAVVTPAMRPLAYAAAFISIFSFFWLAFAVGGYNEAIRKIVIADGVAAVALVAAIVLSLYRQ